MNTPILPDDTLSAIKKMTLITQEMIDATEQQTNCIALRRDLDFYNSVKTKEDLFRLYKKAAAEFRIRQQEFLLLGDNALRELVQLHARLKTESYINMNFLDGIRHKPKISSAK